MRFTVEIFHGGGSVSGSVLRPDGAQSDFTGWLELMRLLQSSGGELGAPARVRRVRGAGR